MHPVIIAKENIPGKGYLRVVVNSLRVSLQLGIAPTMILRINS
jgi:hypothetical protein